ncbi:chromatin-remodeling ATPase INO80-like isoform X2 [Impatiens glandulifera]|nr:chromatin-remodeling ATPase INO80-like isoform X2 [Impatiens glandulifera]
MQFQLPQRDDDLDYYGNNCQDESIDSQGGIMANHTNGSVSDKIRKSKKKRRTGHGSSEDDEDGSYNVHITEEHYRSMLCDHIQKYKRKHNNFSSSSVSDQIGMSAVRVSSRVRKFGNDQHRELPDIEPSSDFLNDISRRRFTTPNGIDRSFSNPSYLDIDDDITYTIYPPFEEMAALSKMPSVNDMRIEEDYLKGTLDLGSLARLMANNMSYESSSHHGMSDPNRQFESLHARLQEQAVSNAGQKFQLKVIDIGPDSSIPEGAAGRIRRSILSEGGLLQVYYVKVLEKGDTYEIIERSLPKKLKSKKDPSIIEKEEIEKTARSWVNIARRDILKHHKLFTSFHRKQLADAKKFSEICQREVKMKVSRTLKLSRSAAIRTRKLSRDMLVLWKRVDKEMMEVRRREEKEAAEALKRDLELREAKRQQQRLNFLLSQTELYSHFMQNKPTVQASEALDKADEKLDEQEILPTSSEPTTGEEEDAEEAELKREALRAAQEAVSKQKKFTSDFDSECSRFRQDGADPDSDQQDMSVEESNNMDLLHPSTMPVTSTVQTPDLFKGSLKEYQLKGLQWLVNCYEQGLNGILADEMGLGKTIQAMAFLAHLAEEKNIWGPFLVVAPASVLNNWADEISRFCPDLKTLPYWGGLPERMILRKNMIPKRLYRRDAGFHILITSYQLLVADEKYFRRIKWQYMVLDEAQAIKSANSIRWKTLLSFNCRNRLLLTGTPVQNNMAELWALLHFIMPTLFDSHEQFNEWFSKGIESHAEHGGTLNEHQLNRLHAILKPFMLRRVKKDVVSELTTKKEITVHCKLSSRQQAFYQAIKNKISLSELFDSNRGHLNDKRIMTLMNIVIQLRKVCNHPELFERNEGSSYFYFGEAANSLSHPPFGELEDIYYSGARNLISYKMPKLVYKDIIQGSTKAHSSEVRHGINKGLFLKHFNIFSPENVYHSQRGSTFDEWSARSGSFGFARLIDLSPAEVAFLATGSFMERLLFSIARWECPSLDGIVDFLMEDVHNDAQEIQLEREKVRVVTKMLLLPSRPRTNLFRSRPATGSAEAPLEALVMSDEDRVLYNVRLLQSVYSFIPKTRAPPIGAHCSDRNFAYQMTEELQNPWIKRLFIGFARTSGFNGPRKPGCPHHLIEEIDSAVSVSQPALQLTHKIFGSSPPMRSFDPARMLTDSGKLQTLDILLKRLKSENHRVLLFAQMTKMLNILEDYMNYRKYRYLRLDGSSTIMDRRDMVRDFQHRNDIFVFLLSTRAGGLGINLTAADTVIFYESDWNPTLDLQAMDRAHRLGQTKDVTVYRLICKETVEEKILQRASQKNTVQQLVMTGGHVQGELLAPEDVVSLLIDDPQLEQKLKEIPLQARDRQGRKGGTKGILVNADGDASFEDVTNGEHVNGSESGSHETEKTKTNNKKRKAAGNNQNKNPKQRPPKVPKRTDSVSPDNDMTVEAELEQQKKPKRAKRATKSVNETIEPAFTATSSLLLASEQAEDAATLGGEFQLR